MEIDDLFMIYIALKHGDFPARYVTKKNQRVTWVCLKIVYPIVPNGFADHYPVFKWLAIIGNINPTFSDKAISQVLMEYIPSSLNGYFIGNIMEY